MCSKTKKVKCVSIPLTDYQAQKVEYLANKAGVTPQFIIYDLERKLEQFFTNKTGEEFINFVNCLKIEKLKKDIDKKKKDIVELKAQIKELDKRLKEYEDDYIAIIELSKALDSLLKVSRGG